MRFTCTQGVNLEQIKEPIPSIIDLYYGVHIATLAVFNCNCKIVILQICPLADAHITKLHWNSRELYPETASKYNFLNSLNVSDHLMEVEACCEDRSDGDFTITMYLSQRPLGFECPMSTNDPGSALISAQIEARLSV